MLDLLRLASTFMIILFLLRRKWNVGYVLLAASGALALFYLLHPSRLLLILTKALTAGITVKLLVALTFIRIFEFILRDRAILAKMMESMKGLFRNKKAVVISMPLLIGMLPSVGGAYFSAPMVDEATRDLSIPPEEKAFANYWFRHPWEFILPLYPGIILASVLTSIEVRTFILLNLPYAVVMVAVGLWVLRGIRGRYEVSAGVSRKGLWSFLPIVILLGLVMVLHMELHVALVILVFMLLAYFRYPARKIAAAFRYGFSLDVVVLILGVMFFKETLEVSGAVGNISAFFHANHIPLLPILFLLPFMTGVMTGITVGFVGSTFPLIMSLAGSDPHAFTLAFAAGFTGVLLSPVHVCLVLTREYFNADMWGIYRRAVPAAGAVLLGAVLEFLLM